MTGADEVKAAKVFSKAHETLIQQMTKDYYAKKLSAERLKRVYQIAGPRVRQYLQAEVDHLAGLIGPHMSILELGVGYGRVLKQLAHLAAEAWGVDNSVQNIEMARRELDAAGLEVMDAAELAFEDNRFDLVFGVQNFISACKTPPDALLKEAVRVTKPRGLVLLSSYAPQFWPHRLQWFSAQADEGLLGPIDHAATGNGLIVCTDGFSAATFSPEQFAELAESLSLASSVYVIDGSSVFCRVEAP